MECLQPSLLYGQYYDEVLRTVENVPISVHKTTDGKYVVTPGPPNMLAKSTLLVAATANQVLLPPAAGISYRIHALGYCLRTTAGDDTVFVKCTQQGSTVWLLILDSSAGFSTGQVMLDTKGVVTDQNTGVYADVADAITDTPYVTVYYERIER